jgi:allophanate hydrolase subunit 2
MSKLVISSIGPASSVQDAGRPGSQRYGLVPSGAMDRLALAAANTLVGNEMFAAGVEVGPFGAVVTAREGAVRIALSGAPRNADISGTRWRSIAPPRLQTAKLTLGYARGVRSVILRLKAALSGPGYSAARVNAAQASAALIRARCKAATS